MADNNEIVYEFGIEGSQANTELKKLLESVTIFSDEMAQVQRRLASQLDLNAKKFIAQTTKMYESLDNAIIKGDQGMVEKLQRRISQLERAARVADQDTRNDFSKGSPRGVDRRVAQSSVLSDARNTTSALAAEYNLALGKLARDAIKGLYQQVEASFKQEMNKAKMLISNTTDEVLNANLLANDRRNTRKIAYANADPALYVAEDILAARKQADTVRKAMISEEVLGATEVLRTRREADMVRKANVSNELLGAEQVLKDRREADAIRRSQIRKEVLDARAIMAQRHDDDTVHRAQTTPAAYGNERTLARISDASFIGIQGRLMANYAVLNQVFSAFTSVSGAVVQLDKEFHQIQAITGATSIEMKGLSGTILDLGTHTRFSTVELAQAAVVLGQAGLSASQTGQALQGVSNLATAAGTDMATATDVLTSTLAIFDIQAENTAHVADILTGALNSSKLDIQKLGLGLQYAGNIAAQSAVPLEELVSILGALADSGVRGSTAGTGVRQLLLDLTTPSEKMLAVLKRLGISIVDIDIKTNGFVGVLDNLRRAGFTTSDALESFEVRGAAAFTALENNRGTIDRIHDSLLLTSAATDAAKIQMEGLANTSLRLVNTLTAIAYEGFAPVDSALSAIIGKIADFFNYLREFSGAIKALGTGFAIFFGAKAISFLAGMADGFLGISASIKALPAVLAAARTGMLAFAAATTVAEGATIALGFATNFIKANPVLIAVTAVAAVIGAVALWKSTQADLNAELDKTKTKLSDDNEKIASATQSVQSISEAITDLGRNSKALDQDTALGGGMMRSRVLELKSAFGELGLELKNSVNPTVKELIDALNQLRTDVASKLPDAISLKLADMQTEMMQIQGMLDQRALPYSVKEALRPHTVAGRGINVTTPALADTLGPNFVKGADFLTPGRVPLPTDALDLNRILGQLTTQRNASSGESMKVLTDLIDALTELKGTLLKRDVNEIEQKSAQQALLTSKANVTLGPQINKTDALGVETTSGVADIIKTYGNNPVLLAQKLTEFKQRMSDEFEVIRKDLDTAEKDMIAKGASPSEAKAAVAATGIADHLNQYLGDIGARLSDNSKEVTKILKRKNQEAKESNSKDIARLQSQLKDTTNGEDAAQIEALINKALDTKRQITREAFKLDDQTSPELQAGQALAQSEINAEQQDSIAAYNEHMKKIGQATNDLAISVLESQADAIKREMERLKSSYNGKTPISAIASIIDQLNTLMGQLLGVNTRIDTLKKLEINPTKNGLTTGPNATSIQQMIVAAANAKGLDQATALAIAKTESNYNSNATNPNSSAAGIYQLLKATADQFKYDRNTAAGQIAGGTDVMLQNKNLFESKYGRVASPEDLYLSHFLGAEGYDKALAFPQGNAAQVLGKDVVTANNGSMDQTVDAFLASVRARFAGNLTEAKQVLVPATDPAADKITAETVASTADGQAKIDAAKKDLADRILTSTVKDLKKEAEASETSAGVLVQQSRILKDPENLKALEGTVRKKLDETLKLQLAAFDKTPDADPEARQVLIDQFKDKAAAILGGIQAKYLDAIDKDNQKPVESLKRQLDQANKQGNGPLATQLGKQLDAAEILAAQKTAIALMKEQASAQDYLAKLQHQGTASTGELTTANEQLVSVSERVIDAQKKLNDLLPSATQQQIDYGKVIDDTTMAWMKQQGVIYDTNNQVDVSATKAQTLATAWNDVLTGMSSAFTTLFTDLAEGNKTLGQTFKDFGRTVLKVFQDIFIKMAVMKTMQLIFGDGSGGAGGTNFLSTIFQALFKPGLAIGGGNPGRDSVPRMLMPGEVVMRKSAVDLIGANRLTEINNFGNRKVSDSIQPLERSNGSGGGHVSVYVVSQDQIPPPSPNEIVAHVANNIQTRGSLKQLIKQVQMGAI